MATPPAQKLEQALALVEASIKSGALQDALDVLEPMLDSETVPATAHRLAAKIAGRQDDAGKALRHMTLALEAAPAVFPKDLVELAEYAYHDGSLALAIEQLDAVPEKVDPRLKAVALFIRIRCLARLRRIDEARASIRQLTSLEGRSLRTKWLIAETNQAAGDHEGARTRYVDLLGESRIPASIRVSIAYGLARSCDRLGRADEAFDAATKGGRLESMRFDAARHTEATDRTIDWATPERLQTILEAPAGDPRPVFVIGLPRSGTSLVEQIVASHPEAEGIGERRDPLLLADRLGHRFQTSFPEVLDRTDPGSLDAAASAYLQVLDRASADAKRVVNKALCLERVVPLLLTLFPSAKIVFVTRHPLDQSLSCLLHQIRGPGLEWTSSLEGLVVARRNHDRLVEHWRSNLPTPTHLVSYESLVDDQERETRRLLDFLELPFDPCCLRFFETDRVVMTPSFDQVDQPLVPDKVGRWRPYASHLSSLIEAFPPEEAP